MHAVDGFTENKAVIMNRVRLQLGADIAHAKGFYGEGVGVAILDSGILPHPDFVRNGNRILRFVDFTENAEFADKRLIEVYRHGKTLLQYRDPAGHGTHVAGILCGDGALSAGKYCGLAPKSHIVCCRVLDEKGEGSATVVGEAIRWVIANKEKYGIRILNLSFGSTENGTEAAVELNALAETAWDCGLVVVASSGNSGPMPGSVTAPGSSKKVITVGGEAIELKPGRGPTFECVMKPELVAPSSGIMSTAASGAGSGNRGVRYYYTGRRGTSMATPMVSGAIAVLLGCMPELTNKEVKAILRDSAVSIGFSKEIQGWGRVNLQNMLREAGAI